VSGEKFFRSSAHVVSQALILACSSVLISDKIPHLSRRCLLAFTPQRLTRAVMIFIWSSNGGPLQYVGIGLFLLQFFPMLNVQFNFTQLQLLVLSLVLMTSGIALGWYTGALARFVNVASSSMVEARDWVQHTTGVTGTFKISCIILCALVAFAVMGYFGGPEAVIIPFHIIAAFLLIKGAIADEREAHEEAQRNDAATTEERMAEIVLVVQNMPIEEFVPKDDVDTKCSISQLKKMLENRGKQIEGSCLERCDLVNAVKECRNYSETCCICCEDYEKGDPLRILPKCQHEFHLECLDQWAYTFANKSKRSREPSCPLCNSRMS